MENLLKLAIPNKGALSEGAVKLLGEAGYRCFRSGRELIVADNANGIDFVFLRSCCRSASASRVSVSRSRRRRR